MRDAIEQDEVELLVEFRFAHHLRERLGRVQAILGDLTPDHPLEARARAGDPGDLHRISGRQVAVWGVIETDHADVAILLDEIPESHDLLVSAT